MAGTPTPNYQFPTYAETDTPNLAGAYNQAVNAIDAKIKEVADTIPSSGSVPNANSTTKGIAKLYDSASVGDAQQDDGGVTPKAVSDAVTEVLTGYAPKFTATAPITYSENKIGIRNSNPSADGSQNGYGAVQVTGKQQDIANASSLTTATVPNVRAVKDYVDAKVPVEQQAYTSTAPIVVDNGSHTISANAATESGIDEDGSPLGGAAGVVNKLTAENPEGAARLDNGTGAYSYVPTAEFVKYYVQAHTPDASTSVKGLVQLNDSGSNTEDHTMAITANGVIKLMNVVRSNTIKKITVQDLANNLYVSPATGLVFWKQS